MFSRLNNGRFDEEAAELEREQKRHAEEDAKKGKTNASTITTTSTTTGKTTVVGSSQARFLGEYNPLLNKPIERRNMNSDVVLLPELTKALEDLQHSDEYHRNHKKKDSVKGYLDEVAKFSAATKFRK